jgi:ATP-binding cassette subfamily B multidrug efflux pump
MDTAAKKSKEQMIEWPTLKRLLKYVFKTAPAFNIIAIIAIAINAGAVVYGSLFIRQLIDRYITPMLRQKTPDFGPLIRALGFLALIYIIGVLANYLAFALMVLVGQRVQKNLRDEMFEHMEHLPISYFDQTEYGDTMSIYTNDVDTLNQMIDQSMPQMVNSALSWLFVLCGMLAVSWQLTIISIVIFGLVYGIVRYLTVNSSKQFNLQQKRVGEMNGYNEEMLSGLKVIKVFSHEDEVRQDFEKYNRNLQDASAKANIFATVLFPIVGNMANLLYVLIALIGGGLSLGGVLTLTIGQLASFLQMTRSFTMPVAQISQQLNSIVLALAGAKRIFALLDQKEETNEGKIELTPDPKLEGAWRWQVPQADGTVASKPVRGHIEFDHVNFGYVPGQLILHDISIDAKPGMKIALVGETGAGKTTISNMINRFYEINSGKIIYDGLDTKQIDKRALRSSVSIVLQETHMFTGTIMENIRFGNSNASDSDVYLAARLAHADEFITELDDGYQTVIDGDGGDLSQGQMQLLSIARAMISNRPVMILDEATSSIDTNTERMVQAGMDNLLAGRTSFVIAHRLSTIVNSDLILVLDHGNIIEAGNHQELLAQHGYYYQLYTGKRELN